MATDKLISITDYPRKDTVAVLEGVAIMLPEWKVIRTNGKVDDVGIPKPTAAPTAAVGSAGTAGEVPNGEYRYKVTYKTSEGFYGEGSDTFTVDTAGGDNEIDIDLSNLTNFRAHSAITHIQIWRTQAGGTILFYVDEVVFGTQSFTDDNSDAAISVNNTLQVAEQAFIAPTKNTYGNIVKARNRLIAFGAANYWDDASEYRNKVAWSGLNEETGLPMPEGWPAENEGTIQNNGEHLRSGAMLGDTFYLFEENEIWAWVWIDNPDPETGNGNVEPMGTARGAVTFKSLINVDGDLWSMDRNGFFNYKGGQNIAPIEEPVKEEFDRINWRQVAQFHGSYDDKRIYWFVALDEDEECNYAFVLDRQSIKTGKGLRWWLYHYPQGARDSTSYIVGNSSGGEQHGLAGRRVVQIITAQGHEQYLVEGVFLDSVHPGLTTSGAINGAANQVFTPAAGTYLSGNANLAGCFVRFDHPSTPEPLLIASSTTTTFTLKTALGANLPDGTTFTIGRIHGYWRSGQLDAGGPEMMKHFEAVAVVTNPRPLEGEIRIVTRTSRRGEFVAGKTENNRTGYRMVEYEPGSILKTGGRTGTTGNRDGYKEVPVHNKDGRYMEIEVQDDGTPYPWGLVGYYVQSKPYQKGKKPNAG